MPTACFKQAFIKVALNRPGKFSRSKQSRSNVPPKYASAEPVLSEVEGSIHRAPPGCLPLDLPRGGEPALRGPQGREPVESVEPRP